MSDFALRDRMDRVLHPEQMWAPPQEKLGLPEIFQTAYRSDAAGGQGPQTSPTRFITGHYETTQGAFDPGQSVGTLATQEERFRALNQMTQQQAGDLDSEQRCGAMVLLAGSMLGGGGSGITTLIDAVEAMKKKSGGALDKATLAQMADLDKLKAKIAKKEELTAGDLTTISSDVFSLMQGKDSEGGTSSKAMQELFKSSPALRKLWHDNDLSYDSVDVTGAHQGGHAVLGIGHGKGDKAHQGPHQAVYDPYRRTTRDTAAVVAVEDAGADAAFANRVYGPDDPHTIEATERLKAAQAAEKATHKNAGQLVTSRDELDAYLHATDKSYEMNTTGTPFTFSRPSGY